MTSETLKAAVETLLRTTIIRKVTSFGWLDGETPDPDYVGYAMWHIQPAIDDPSVFVPQAPSPNVRNHSPTEWQKLLNVSATDFDGLMEAARLSIGLLMTQIEASKVNDFAEDDFLELHRMSSLVYLATASERLREFFIAAAFHKSRRKYDSKSRYKDVWRKEYLTPFIEAGEIVTDTALLESAKRLSVIAEQLVLMRQDRNELVHAVATKIAIRERERLETPPIKPDRTGFLNLDESRRKQASHRAARDREHANIIAQMTEWYMLLVRGFNEAFIFENARRRTI
jgi:hypothetical protein